METLKQGAKDVPYYEGSDEESEMDGDRDESEPDLENQGEQEKSRFPRIYSTAEQRLKNCRQWRKSLILKVLGKNIGFKVLQNRLKDLWKLIYDFELTDVEGGYFIVRFRSKEDYHKVLDGGPWVVQGHYVTIGKWRPKFRVEKEQIMSTLVWVRLPGMPVEYYNEKFLLRIGNVLGKAIKVDQQTLSAARGKYARMILDGGEQPVEEVMINCRRDSQVPQEEEMPMELAEEQYRVVQEAVRPEGMGA